MENEEIYIGDPELEWDELLKLPVDAEDSDDEQKNQ